MKTKNMKKLYNIFLYTFLGIVAASCVDDLDTEPLDKDVTTSAIVLDDDAAYKQFLAKLYGGLTLTGQAGGSGQPDIPSGDEGTTSFMRPYWTMQEITTDEAIAAWNDAGLTDFHGHSWSSRNVLSELLYQRLFVNIAYCNEYVREVGQRVDGLDGELQDEVRLYLAEARFLRALYYYFAMDLYGNVPFVTEEDGVGAYLPEQISRADLFSYIESELIETIPSMAAPRTNEYGRADQAAAWMVLAKMYLNAEVYLGDGNDRYTECITYSKQIIDAGYSLHSEYEELFLADNDELDNEIIFRVVEDGSSGQNYGGTTFIVHAAAGDAPEATFGISGGWFGNRVTPSFVERSFDDPSGETDERALFITEGQTLAIEDPFDFTQGYLCMKFRNLTSEGIAGSNTTFVDTDFPLFRLADVYLMYAEAVERGGTGGDETTALGYVNELRERAYGDDSGNIDAADLTLNFLINERGRELYWEAHRRTDLIRFNLFTTGTYTWDWKGNVRNGAPTSPIYRLFPIPFTDIVANTNLEQNTGY